MAGGPTSEVKAKGMLAERADTHPRTAGAKPLRVLMLAPQPFFEPRGTPFSVLGRLRALSELGHEVDLLTYHVGQDVAIPRVRIHRTPRVPFIKRVRIGPSAPKVLLDLLLFLKALQFLRRGRYDLLHTHEEASFFGVLLARLFRLPHLYDMHSSPTEQLGNFRATGLRPLVRLFDWIERRVVSSSDAVITICPALRDRVALMSPTVPQVMIENVASANGTAEVSEEQLRAFCAAHPWLDGRRVVLYAGTFEPYQGIDLLLGSVGRVAQRRPEVLFLLVGGKPEQVRLHQERAARMGLSPYVRFTGTRPPEEVALFIKLSHVLVSPRTDGTNTPLKVYSYLQSGKPIVATNLYTHTQVLTGDVAVLVEPDEESLARGILTVLEDPELAAALGARAKRLFEANYSFGTYLEKTQQALAMAVR